MQRNLERLRRAAHAGAIPLLALATACAPGGEADGAPPADLLSTITLQESGGLYLARPGGLAIDDAGRAYVSDFFRNHVLRFDGGGRADGVFGGAGHGPGEFGSIGEAILVHDSVVGVLNYDPRGIHFFDTRTREYLSTRRLEGGVSSSGKVVGGTVYLTSLDAARGSSLLVWPMRTDSIRTPPAVQPPLASNFAPMPREYARSDVLRGTYGLVHAAPWSDTLLVGHAGSPFLLEMTRSGEVLDTVYLPVRHRRGIPRDFADRLVARGTPFRELFSMASGLFGLSRTGDGRFVTVHFDSELHGGNRITARVFASVLSPDRERACVDREIAVSGDSQPVIALRGDTLYVLEQHIAKDDRVSTTLKRYRIGDTGCRWLPTDDPSEATR